MKKIDFLFTALKNLNTVGTFTFSSKHLVNKILDPINFDQTTNIVELGTGNGCITEEILARMDQDSKLLSFEINDKFYDSLAHLKDSRLKLIHDSAEKFETYLDNLGIEKLDYVVSSLPMVILPNELKKSIFQSIKRRLKPNGVFIQISYTKKGLKEYKQEFSVTYDHTFRNLPPAYIYICEPEAAA